jgi:hypothetical protein
MTRLSNNIINDIIYNKKYFKSNNVKNIYKKVLSKNMNKNNLNFYKGGNNELSKSFTKSLDPSLVKSLTKSLDPSLVKSLDPSLAKSLAKSIDLSLDSSLKHVHKIIPSNNEIIKSIASITHLHKTKFEIAKEKATDFFKSNFFYFMKYFLYFIILLTICFYITIYVDKNANNNLIKVETKVLFYVLIMFIIIILNDILETQFESLNQFFLIIVFFIIISYSINYLVQHYYNSNKEINKIRLTFIIIFLLYLIFSVIIYFFFKNSTKNIATPLYTAFNSAMKNNIGFLFLITILFYIYKDIFIRFNKNTFLTDILGSTILGNILIFTIFVFIIFLCIKLKIINSKQILNTFIVLYSILFFLILIGVYIFMQSMGNICDNKTDQKNIDNEEKVTLLILASIIILLWLDDTRNWHQIGSIIFVVITLFTFYVTFYYTQFHPNIGLMSTWLFIEWLIIIFYRKENSKNSIHFSFMKT